MLCSPGKNMCLGCANEASRHKRIQQIELEILGNCSPNETWNEVFQLVISSTPTSLKHLRRLVQHIPTFVSTDGMTTSLVLPDIWQILWELCLLIIVIVTSLINL
jgi:hypothetical protein